MSQERGRKANRLIAEKSPYLLQHAYNPVEWYAWGDEAFAAARSQGKPIFLSIGYATCHWCHVMEHESFEDEVTAGFMNRHFINIKVDREEMPDVDQIYMAAVQAISGRGGWPMSVFLTPDLVPFHAGTYYPPVSRWGQPGFIDILRNLSAAWEKQREAVLQNGRTILEAISRRDTSNNDDRIADRGPIDGAVMQLRRGFDRRFGGFGGAPKFPRSMTLMLLLRDRLEAGDADDEKLNMVETTLDRMWRGGIYDHVGGGFARYSTDEYWLVPHFEKMLYDNALLVTAYTEAWTVTRNPNHRFVVEQTLEWVLAEMTHPEGGFYSAQDADSEGEEGRFYLWTPEELASVLGEDDAEFVARVFGVAEGGNFEGRSILYLPHPFSELETILSLSREEILTRWEPLRRKLYAARDARIHPLLDDKILTSWNGLMIGAMARAGMTFGIERYVEAARRAAEFVRDHLFEGGVLLRRHRDGDSRYEGTVEDWSFFASGLFELFRATGDVAWFDFAERLVGETEKRFKDPEGDGYFMVEASTPNLVVRMKEPYDGATPSGNSVAVANVLELASWRGDLEMRERALRTISSFSADLRRAPMAYPLLVTALDRALVPPEEIVVARAENGVQGPLERHLRESFRPHAVMLAIDPDRRAELERRFPWMQGKGLVDGKPAAWICRNFTCQMPITEVSALDAV